MVTPIPLPEERSEGGYDLCPSVSEKWRSVVMVIPIPLTEGRRGEGHCSLWPMASLF